VDHGAGQGGERDGGGADDDAVAADPPARDLGEGIGVGADEAAGEEAAQVGGEVVGARVAGLGVVGHRAVGDGRELARDLRVELAQVAEGALHHAHGQLRRALAAERRLAGQHVVEERAERVDVRTDIHPLAARLLRRHVAQGAHDRAGLGHVGARGAGVGASCLCGHVRGDRAGQVLGEAPVDHDDLAEAADQHVGGLEVAVDDLLRVGVGDRVGDGDHVLEQGEPAREAAGAADLRLEALAVDELHAVIRFAAVAPAEVVQRHDAGVLQAGRDRGLEREAPLGLGAAAQQLLDGDHPAEAAVLGAADDAEAAGGEHLAEHVALAGLGARDTGGEARRGVQGRLVGGAVGRAPLGVAEVGHSREQAGLGAADHVGGRDERCGHGRLLPADVSRLEILIPAIVRARGRPLVGGHRSFLSRARCACSLP
jgi:hypothetical protein